MTEEAATRAKVLRLAALLSEKNVLEAQIAELVGRPGKRGHVGPRKVRMYVVTAALSLGTRSMLFLSCGAPVEGRLLVAAISGEDLELMPRA